MVVAFVHLDFRENLSCGSNYPRHPLRIRGAKLGQTLFGYVQGLENVREFSEKTQNMLQKTVWRSIESMYVKNFES